MRGFKFVGLYGTFRRNDFQSNVLMTKKIVRKFEDSVKEYQNPRRLKQVIRKFEEV